MNENKDIAEGNFVAKWPNWLRWALFLPTAVLGSVIASTLYNILISFGGFFYGANFGDGFYFQLMSSAILGWTFVYFGAFMAPRYQFAVSIALLVVLALFLGLSFLFTLAGLSSIGPISFGFHALAGVIAGAFVVYEHRNN